MTIRLAEKHARDLLGQYEQQAKQMCAPLFWRDADGRLRNASMSLLQTPERMIGVTNNHVADAIANLSVDELHLGGARFDPERLIARHEDLDIATYEVSEILLSMAQHSAGSIAEWPIKLPCNDDVLLVGGWPRSLVEHGQVHGELSFGFLWFAGRINGVSERTISLELQIAESTAISCDYVEPGVDLGGWSGGAVLRCIDSGLIEHIELCGIIYQSDEGSNVVLAHPLASLNSDGTFS